MKEERKLRSLLELGQIIGLDLQLDEMLTQIARKACEVMEADRCSLFLHDPETNELWSTVALGMEGQVIRIPSEIGIAGACFQTEGTINLKDAYSHPRFNTEVDSITGYRTHSLLCMPIHNRSGQKLGVIQLLNKKDGAFTEEDEAFLRTFGNHASVFIEIAQLRKARVDALEQTKKDLERLNRAKSKALNHLSHELRTPIAVIQGNIRLLKRKVQVQNPPTIKEGFFESLEKNLYRLSEIQQETDDIIRSQREMEVKPHLEEFATSHFTRPEIIRLHPFAGRVIEEMKKQTSRRDLQISLDGEEDITLFMEPKILEDVLEGLLKNAIENTPDEGLIRVFFEKKAQWILLKVMDFGIGITKDNQRHLFDGLFHTLDTELYTSKKPYDFGAGGKGLDLLRMKVYGQRFGFDISVGSTRCTHLSTERDLCTGRISQCPHCTTREECLSSGGSTFCLTFRASEKTSP